METACLRKIRKNRWAARQSLMHMSYICAGSFMGLGTTSQTSGISEGQNRDLGTQSQQAL